MQARGLMCLHFFARPQRAVLRINHNQQIFCHKRAPVSFSISCGNSPTYNFNRKVLFFHALSDTIMAWSRAEMGICLL